jgi:hypothetical protein
MIPKGGRILFDTNAIKAAHDHGCWNAIRQHFKVETVEQCLAEVTRCDRHGRTLVARAERDLRTEMVVHPVTALQQVEVVLRTGGMIDLDAGERDLLAYALTLGTAAWWLCGPDKATMRALNKLQLIDRLVALESLARSAGATPKNLKQQYTEMWLKDKRTLLLMGEEII